ncbi:CLUMA_CG002925, isoform A [Clunio marinus]|uniref:CLUMA_CG002925, isoform A n=1 Tax=Clunio marinus TaxID=568069 RepID=A0A1J1HP42_9DIPT|nr:CLUMA_CG002925, isoform A [Clunio marinus]
MFNWRSFKHKHMFYPLNKPLKYHKVKETFGKLCYELCSKKNEIKKKLKRRQRQKKKALALIIVTETCENRFANNTALMS